MVFFWPLCNFWTFRLKVFHISYQIQIYISTKVKICNPITQSIIAHVSSGSGFVLLLLCVWIKSFTQHTYWHLIKSIKSWMLERAGSIRTYVTEIFLPLLLPKAFSRSQYSNEQSSLPNCTLESTACLFKIKKKTELLKKCYDKLVLGKTS